MNQSADCGAALVGVMGESGHATLHFDSNTLPFGPAEFSIRLRDQGGLLSDTAVFTVDVIGEAATGEAPSIVEFTRVAASCNRPIGPYDLLQVSCVLEVSDADDDLALIRVRVTDHLGQQTVTEQAVAGFALTGAGGRVTPALLAFQSTSSLGNSTLQVTPFDRNGHAGTPATATFADSVEAPGQVTCPALQADGKILIGGSFTSVGGHSRSRIARLNADGTLDFTFNPGAGADNEIDGLVLLPDGKILVAGGFSSFGGEQRGRIARLHPNGAVESAGTFNSTGTEAGSFISSLAVQANGHIVLGGAFSNAGGQPAGNIARLDPNGTGETAPHFDPLGGADSFVNAVALQADGRILVGGQFTRVSGEPRTAVTRLVNDPATQEMTVLDATQVTWRRSGATAEISDAGFELSIDGGANWTPLGPGSRIFDGWELAGLSLPAAGSIRARGRTSGGERNGSAGLLEEIVPFTLPAPSFAPALGQGSFTQLGNARTGVTGDPSGKGIPRLAKSDLKLRPQSPQAALFAAGRFVYADGDRLRILIRRDPAHQDLTIEVQAADRVTGPWTTIATSALGAPFSGSGYAGGDSARPGIKSVEIRDPVLVPDAPARFLRVAVRGGL